MGKKSERTKQTICASAKLLFSKKGYKNVTMQEICDSAKISKGGLYRYYKDKATLLFSVMKHNPAADIPINETLNLNATEIFDAYLSFYHDDMLDTENSLAMALYEYASDGHSEVFMNSTLIEEKWKDLIQYGIETGEFHEIDYKVVMNTLLYAYRGVKMWSQVLPLHTDIADDIIKAIRMLVIK